MAKIEHKESHQPDHVDWLSPAEQDLLGGEIGVYDARCITLLNELQRERKITGWRRVSDNSPDDREGKDYWIRINQDEIPLGITGKDTDALRRKRKHPDIPHIFFQREDGKGLKSPEISKREMIDQANWYLNNKYHAMWDSYRRDSRKYK